jgi:hypothetical protein
MVFLDAEDEGDHAMTYILSVAYMCASFLAVFHPCYQLLSGSCERFRTR